jgi:diketogulonate reductase-like aldo/keto reductase
VTTKVWNDDQGYDSALRAFDASSSSLRLHHVDLYLIHWPKPSLDRYVETWRALEKLYADGRVRAIGVSNFQSGHLRRLLDETEIVPAVNQIRENIAVFDFTLDDAEMKALAALETGTRLGPDPDERDTRRRSGFSNTGGRWVG